MKMVAAAKADYYDVLGIPRDADREEIREAYLAAVADPDPDRSDETGVETFFREIAEAYSVLSKPASRLLYDRYGYRGRGNPGFDEALWDALQRGPRGDDAEVVLTLRFKEALRGVARVVRYEADSTCQVCDGRGTRGDVDPDCAACGGTGRRSHLSETGSARFLRVEPCPLCGGDVCEACGGSGREHEERTLSVRVPAGVEDGTRLCVAGEGAVGDRGGRRGDLLLNVVVEPEPDPRLIRYVALALCLAAIALLVAYVLLR